MNIIVWVRCALSPPPLIYQKDQNQKETMTDIYLLIYSDVLTSSAHFFSSTDEVIRCCFYSFGMRGRCRRELKLDHRLKI